MCKGKWEMLHEFQLMIDANNVKPLSIMNAHRQNLGLVYLVVVRVNGLMDLLISVLLLKLCAFFLNTTLVEQGELFSDLWRVFYVCGSYHFNQCSYVETATNDEHSLCCCVLFATG
jgi:hypothetical protein